MDLTALGEVFRVREKATGTIYAAKTFQVSLLPIEHQRMVSQEIAIMKSCQHVNLVQYHEDFSTYAAGQPDKVIIVSEYCPSNSTIF